jgi:hypothetical protein
MPTYNTDAEQIQCEIDSCLAQLQEGWATPMIMSMHVGMPNDDSPIDVDVVAFISSPIEMNEDVNVAYFDRQKYPPVAEDVCVKRVFDSLFEDLYEVARNSGFKIVKQGSLSMKRLAKSKPGHMGVPMLKQFDVACYRCRKHRNQRKKKAPPQLLCQPTQPPQESSEEEMDEDLLNTGNDRDHTVFRLSSLHGDKLNSRGLVGKKMSRRTHTNRPLTGDQTCKFRFVVRLNQYGFYIERKGKNYCTLITCSV